MARKQYNGGSVASGLSSGINNVVTSLTGTDLASFPDGSVGPFVVRIGGGTSSEEKVLATGRSGNSLTGLTRGYDGTSAVTHSSGEVLEHVLDALTVDEANAHVNDDGRDDHSQYFNTARHAAVDHDALVPALADLGTWAAYTPTLSGTGWALGAGTISGRYTRTGDTVTFDARVTFGAGMTAGAGRPFISFPVLPHARYAAAAGYLLPNATFADASGGTYLGAWFFEGSAPTGNADLRNWSTTGDAPDINQNVVTSTSPFPWASGDTITIWGTYEAAA